MIRNNQLAYWLLALHLPKITLRKIKECLTYFSSIKTLFEASLQDLKNLNLTEETIHFILNPQWQLVEEALSWAEKPHHHLISIEDEAYPYLLQEIANPPLVLFVQGNKTILKDKQIAMVGTRNPTPIGIKNAGHFANALAQAGFIITSGLALGIDGASHRGTLAVEGLTIGVAGTGLNYIYPSSHQTLFKDIIENDGAIVSEFWLDTPPRSINFPRRNRIIAGLSLGTLVVEAALKSGSLITARYALEQGREVFAIPGPIHQPSVKGCHYLIREGAKLVETVEDILEELSAWNEPPHEKRKSTSATKIPKKDSHGTEVRQGVNDLSSDLQHVLAQIGYEITPLDVILWRSGLTVGQLSSILLILELKGYITLVAGGYVRSL